MLLDWCALSHADPSTEHHALQHLLLPDPCRAAAPCLDTWGWTTRVKEVTALCSRQALAPPLLHPPVRLPVPGWRRACCAEAGPSPPRSPGQGMRLALGKRTGQRGQINQPAWMPEVLQQHARNPLPSSPQSFPIAPTQGEASLSLGAPQHREGPAFPSTKCPHPLLHLHMGTHSWCWELPQSQAHRQRVEAFPPSRAP